MGNYEVGASTPEQEVLLASVPSFDSTLFLSEPRPDQSGDERNIEEPTHLEGPWCAHCHQPVDSLVLPL